MFLAPPILSQVIDRSRLYPRAIPAEETEARELAREISRDSRTKPLRESPEFPTVISDFLRPEDGYSAWTYDPSGKSSVLIVVGKDPNDRQLAYWAEAIPQKLSDIYFNKKPQTAFQDIYERNFQWVITWGKCSRRYCPTSSPGDSKTISQSLARRNGHRDYPCFSADPTTRTTGQSGFIRECGDKQGRRLEGFTSGPTTTATRY